MTKKNWLLAGCGLAALAALAAVAISLRAPDEGAAADPASEVALGAAPLREPRIFQIVVEKGRLASGPDRIAVDEGDHVVLRVAADANDELRLRGYDLTMALAPHLPAELRFTADKPGRFEYGLLNRGLELGVLEVEKFRE